MCGVIGNAALCRHLALRLHPVRQPHPSSFLLPLPLSALLSARRGFTPRTRICSSQGVTPPLSPLLPTRVTAQIGGRQGGTLCEPGCEDTSVAVSGGGNLPRCLGGRVFWSFFNRMTSSALPACCLGGRFTPPPFLPAEREHRLNFNVQRPPAAFATCNEGRRGALPATRDQV